MQIPPKRVYRNPIIVAQEWQAILDGSQVASRKELAQTFGVSRVRISQMLQLLTLSPSVIDAIVQLGDPMSERIVSERSLRGLAGIERDQQAQWVARVLGSPILDDSQLL